MSHDETNSVANDHASESKSESAAAPVKKELSDAAKRALAEAEERRIAKDAERTELAKEYGGRGGADPSRFGDWEIDGRAIDF